MSKVRGERGFRELVENAPDVIARFDKDLRYVYVNPAVRAATGRGPEEYVGRTNRDLAGGDSDEDPGMAAVRERWDEALRGVFETGRPTTFELEVPRPGGRRWYESRMVPELEEDGSVGTVVAISRDVTEHKRARERLERLGRELREQGETLGALLDGLAEGVLAFDEGGRTVFANPAAREMLGLGCGDLPEETPDPFEGFALPREVARCAGGEGCAEAMATSGGARLRVRLRHLDEFDGDRGGVLVVLEDLSEGRPLEAAQQRFLANAAHELKTPLTAITGAAELLLSGAGDDPETRRRFLGHVSGEARRLRRLADALLGLARTGHDAREPELEAVDLLGVSREAASRMEPVARSSGVGLRVEGERDHACCADPEWLEQALVAVLDNAVKYSGPGGTVTLSASGSSISVQDEGKGISEAEIPRIFEAFYRSEGSRRSAEGAGLGLFVCRDLVERMGGSVSVNSREGSGTTVRIELPNTQTPGTGRPAPPRRGAPHRPG